MNGWVLIVNSCQIHPCVTMSNRRKKAQKGCRRASTDVEVVEVVLLYYYYYYYYQGPKMFLSRGSRSSSTATTKGQ